MYSLFLLIGALVSMVMCSNGVEEKLRKIPFLCNGTKDNAAEVASLTDRYVKFEPR